MDFNAFEKDVMKKLLSGEEETLNILREQYKQATLKKREYTGHGCFTYFSVPESAQAIGQQDLQFGDVEANIEGLGNGIGFVLFITNGKIDFLESYTYGEVFPKKIKKYEISYIDGKRDLAKIRKKS